MTFRALESSDSRALQPPLQNDDLLITPIDRLTPARLTELLHRAVARLLTPVRQMRRIQALPPQQLADLARPGARVRLRQDLRLVLRGEPTALGLLDQLRVRRPHPRGAPARHTPQLRYAPLVCVAGGSLVRGLGSTRARLLHVRQPPFSPSRSIIP